MQAFLGFCKDYLALVPSELQHEGINKLLGQESWPNAQVYI